MEMSKIAEHARALYNAHGDKAEAEAARQAKERKEAGDSEQAEVWTSVRKAIREIRGARQT
ncbi:hypothetical protein HKCCE3408_13305 [Rhodobacterales bacterium HKCCE3408]|nr:hypothetical protein [Rhodobacterales bacterium HKCCE3408]